jgi:hypothetical protein
MYPGRKELGEVTKTHKDIRRQRPSRFMTWQNTQID